MDKLEAINRWASQLSAEQIENLPEEEVLMMAMERPGHPGQFGFMLGLEYFRSREHLAETMCALYNRLVKIDNLKVKMKDRK